ncbi:LacI family transcriptional regulator [Dictyobacter alpinus]|uniref:LacI family transcriptional regulator n=1 Tax=Dictyobacter alpinus TaxID=2014873 RepID=A0A402BGQ1_9CHLR|nr:LacI family DNA-binding transcriptional regulator [Dictyobacter alpinus]GCE30591.1 LacI family transcriptional regulator [Dictyobacter alpinus]
MSGSLINIAARAGVSIATVSRALNGKDGVKPETRERILSIAQELQQTSSFANRAMSATKTATICYVVNQLHSPVEDDPFYPIIMRGVEEELANHGYHLLLTTINGRQVDSVETFKPVAEGRVDGLILAGPDISTNFISELKQIGMPVVLIDNNLPSAAIDSVNIDDLQGSQWATEHLLAHGHSSIVALLGPETWFSSARRGLGYQLAMQQAKLTPHIFRAEDTNMETGMALIKEALTALPKLSAIFTANDAMAFGAIRWLQQNQLRVPEDVAVIGYDDTLYSALSSPTLTTMRVFKRELGMLAARRILTMLAETEQEERHTVQTLLASELVLRHSCGC